VPLVLALEPDLRQATILKRVIRDNVHADLIVVDRAMAGRRTIACR
jgi:hypothetical protein